MKETDLPPIELFIPEKELSPATECAQIAFNLISVYGMEFEEKQENFVICMNVTDRVDANNVGPDGVKVALRLRTAPMFCIDGENGIPDIEGRDFGVALLECGTREIDEFNEPEYLYDEDFKWDARVAIILDIESDDEIYVCDAATGRELSYAEQMNLMYLLEYVQKNLQAELTKTFAENAAESSRSIPVRDTGFIEFEPSLGEFIHGNECSECGHRYGHCEHRKHTLN